jgi:sugar/nucleoside kinase (ribokinase family)
MRSTIRDRPRDVVVAGHVNVDRFLRVDRFPESDRTVPVTADRVALGGTAALIAVSAARRGVRAGLIARVGGDFPLAFRRELAKAGVDLRGLEQVAGRGSPTCYIVEDRRGAQRTLIDQGPMGDARGARRPGPWLKEYSWIHLGTGDPRFQLGLASVARARGLHVAADPAQEIFYRWPAAALRRLLASAEILFGNEAEVRHAAELAGARDPAGLLERVPLIVRTEGRRGASAFSRDGTVHVPARRPRVVRTEVGAGDAFRGGFYAAWFEGKPLRACLDSGARAAVRRIEGAG